MVHLHHFSKIKSQKESQNSRNPGFSYYFCMMIEGSGSGSIPLTNGFGSGRPKKMWIRWIRIRIRIPDPYLWLMDPYPGGPKTCGSGLFLNIKNSNFLFPMPPWRKFMLQEKPSALKRENPEPRNRKFLHFLLLLWPCGSSCPPGDPDPANQNQNQWGSMRIPDPQHCVLQCVISKKWGRKFFVVVAALKVTDENSRHRSRTHIRSQQRTEPQIRNTGGYAYQPFIIMRFSVFQWSWYLRGSQNETWCCSHRGEQSAAESWPFRQDWKKKDGCVEAVHASSSWDDLRGL